MVLEALLSHRGIETRPVDLFVLISIVFMVSCAITASIFSGAIQEGIINPIGAGYLIVAFITIALVPLFHRLLMVEEEKDLCPKPGESFFNRHRQIISVYTVLFLTVIFSSSLAYVFLPREMSLVLFRDQERELNIIRGQGLTGAISGFAASYISGIFENNLRVLVLAFFFSVVFGAGAVFILSWNAAVVGVLVGQMAHSLPYDPILSYLIALPMTLFSLVPHGIFEIGAYFVGALSGGILSVALSSQCLTISGFKAIMKDVIGLFVLAIVMLIVGALIEVSL